MDYKIFLGMGYEKFLGIAIDIFTGFSCEIFLGISADSQERFLGICTDFPQNCYLGRHGRNKLIKKYDVRAETDLLNCWLSEENKTKKSQDIAERDQLKDEKKAYWT